MSFSGTGITVNSTTYVSSTTLTAVITIMAGATTGLRTVTVTNPDGVWVRPWCVHGECQACGVVDRRKARGVSATSQGVTVTGRSSWRERSRIVLGGGDDGELDDVPAERRRR